MAQLKREQLAEIYRQRTQEGTFAEHKSRIERDLWLSGADTYDFLVPETHNLPLIIHPNEHIVGVVYGRYKQNMQGKGVQIGRGMLIATDGRLLLLDKKPLFLKCEEVAYEVVSGVSFSRVGPIGTVTLFTRMGDMNMRTFNRTCAENFVEAIEGRIFNGLTEGYRL